MMGRDAKGQRPDPRDQLTDDAAAYSHAPTATADVRYLPDRHHLLFVALRDLRRRAGLLKRVR